MNNRLSDIPDEIFTPVVKELQCYVAKIGDAPLYAWDAADILYNALAVLCSSNHDNNNWENIEDLSEDALDAGHLRVTEYIETYNGKLPSYLLYSIVRHTLEDMLDVLYPLDGDDSK